MLARVIYEAVENVELDTKVCIKFKDGDSSNIIYDNIEVVNRPEYFNESRNKYRKFDEKTCEEIRRKYNREERKKHNFAGEYAHPSYQELAEEYGCSKTTILHILNDTYRDSERERGIGKWAKQKEEL